MMITIMIMKATKLHTLAFCFLLEHSVIIMYTRCIVYGIFQGKDLTEPEMVSLLEMMVMGVTDTGLLHAFSHT